MRKQLGKRAWSFLRSTKKAKANSGRRLRHESLETRCMLAAQPIITEFLASNSDVLDDEDGDSSDWIELYNAGDMPLDLNGWYLTDDAGDLTQWSFPAVTLGAGDYLVVFASGKDRADADGTELHTNFSLSAAGEYLGLVEPDGSTIAYEFAPTFPVQTTDISYGLGQSQSETLLIDEGSTATYIVPTGPIANWYGIGFDDSAWSSGLTGIGYENSPADYDAIIESTVPLDTDTFYMRQTFDVTDPSTIDQLRLRLRYDDGFAAYLNGTLVASSNATATLAYNSIATANHDDAEAVEFVGFDLSNYTDLLIAGTNVLAVQALNQATSSDMLLETKLLAFEVASGSSNAYLIYPTPGDPNVGTGPLITSVTENPPALISGEDLVIETAVSNNAGNGIASVHLHYRIDFGQEVAFEVFDNGLGSDLVAGDGIYTGVISSSAYNAGDMVRWYVTAEDNSGTLSRAPNIVDTDGNSQDPEYYGTVVFDPSINTVLPVFQWFTQDEAASHSRAGTRASVYYNGLFYDNIFVRQRGGYTNSAISQKFDFNKGYNLFVNDELGYVGEINMNGNGYDSSYLRQTMGFDAHTESGGAASASFLTYVSLNGSFDRVGVWIEQVDEDFLERQGYDEDGDLYKLVQRSNLNPAVSDSTTGLEKKTGDTNDFSSFQDLVDGLALRTEAERQAFLRDYIDIPQFLNYMAVRTLQHQADDIRKNMYFYLDTQGDNLWRIFPWDLDWTFNIVGGHDNQDSERTEHPFFGTEDFPTADGNDQWNVLFDVLFETVEVQEMYLRRVRTLMDQFYGGATGGVTWFAEYVNTLFPDIDPHLGSSATSGKNSLLASIEDRRDELYNVYTANIPGYSVVIPGEQTGTPTIEFGEIDFNPIGGNQDQEYIALINNNSTAVDISGWTLTGGISHTFQAGTVIAPGSTLYVTASVADFRLRETGPTGGQSLFVQEWNSGHLSSLGETIQLVATDTTVVDELTYEGDPSEAQEYIRITELHYHPSDPTTAEQQAGFTSHTQFEFVEIANTSPTETIDLAGLSFTDGIEFTFGEESTTNVLAADFNSGVDGFGYQDDLFYDTNNPDYAVGTYEATGGAQGDGALRVYLNSPTTAADRGAASGGWTSEFTLTEATTVVITLDYRMVLGHGFEADEFGELLVEVDGERLGSDVSGSLLHVAGDGQNPVTDPVDSGWQTGVFELLLTPGTHQISLGGYNNKSTLSDEDAEFWFDNLTVATQAYAPIYLAPGERLVVVNDPQAFEYRYGTNVRVAGQYSGNLSNGGETIKLDDANNSTILDFEYYDGNEPGEELWPSSPDGGGPSLVVVDAHGDYNLGSNWMASSIDGGTPGMGEGSDLAGDYNGDSMVTHADYLIWKSTIGSTDDLRADGNNDGQVSLADYTIWRDNLGAITQPGALASSTEAASEDAEEATPATPQAIVASAMPEASVTTTAETDQAADPTAKNVAAAYDQAFADEQATPLAESLPSKSTPAWDVSLYSKRSKPTETDQVHRLVAGSSTSPALQASRNFDLLYRPQPATLHAVDDAFSTLSKRLGAHESGDNKLSNTGEVDSLAKVASFTLPQRKLSSRR
ncbi:lamin tail domain-containing protein [Aeoliella mucimassa]|uniref:lamin tail domain-containing protein n=1 Tax=Aeoliella mucimassa TaxID=2527972 RepID=UPI0018D2DEBE|nr:lamin tail domain-containing protein [Aeoliella mucimassa]